MVLAHAYVAPSELCLKASPPLLLKWHRLLTLVGQDLAACQHSCAPLFSLLYLRLPCGLLGLALRRRSLQSVFVKEGVGVVGRGAWTEPVQTLVETIELPVKVTVSMSISL